MPSFLVVKKKDICIYLWPLKNNLELIEVYDNSHIQGSDAIGALICFGNEGFVKKRYRKFNIKNEEIKGAIRWFRLGGISIQPSEFVKPSFAIISAWMFASWRLKEDFPGYLVSVGLYLVVVALLLMQPDVGMSILVSVVWGIQFFLAGLPMLLVLVIGLIFISAAFFFKIAAAPLHMWSPDVYEGAPTSITSYFAVVPKVAGLAVLIKFMLIPFSKILMEWQTIIIFISIASMILGAVAAIGQKNVKRLLAYSSIGHIGYALAGVATGVISGYESAIVYISIYVVMNIGAFSCLYLLKKDGEYKENISDLSGISKKHPMLAISFLVILFSLAGIPPLGGFFAKFYVFTAVVEQKMYALAIIGLLTTVISAFYYLKIIKTIYFDDSVRQGEHLSNLIDRAIAGSGSDDN